MLTAEARVNTSDPGRYLAQFGRHAAAKGEHGPAMIRRMHNGLARMTSLQATWSAAAHASI